MEGESWEEKGERERTWKGKGQRSEATMGGIKLSHPGIIQLMGFRPCWELSRGSPVRVSVWGNPSPGKGFALLFFIPVGF